MGDITRESFVFIPNTIYTQIRTFAVVGCTFQTAIYNVVRRILVRHIKLWGHHSRFALLCEIFRTTQYALEISCFMVYAVVNHHASTIGISL